LLSFGLCHGALHSTFVAPSSESRVTPLRADHKETLLYHAAQSGRKAPIYFSSVATPRRAPYKVGRPSKQASGNLALGQMLQKVPRFGRLTCSQVFGCHVVGRWPTCRCHLQHPQRQVRVSSSATSGGSHVSEIARHANLTSCALACLALAWSVCVCVCERCRTNVTLLLCRRELGSTLTTTTAASGHTLDAPLFTMLPSSHVPRMISSASSHCRVGGTRLPMRRARAAMHASALLPGFALD